MSFKLVICCAGIVVTFCVVQYFLMSESRFVNAYPIGNWVPIGDGESKQIAVASNNQTGAYYAFTVDAKVGSVYYKQQSPNGTWTTEWKPLIGSSKQIAVGNDRNGSLVLFSIGLNSNIPHYKQQLPNGSWSTDWVPLGGESKQIAVGDDRNGSLVLFSIGLVDNLPYYKQQLGNGSWSTEWVPLGDATKQIVVGNDRNGSLVLMSIGMADNTPYYKQQLPNGSWSTDWISLGGESKQIAVGHHKNGSLVLFSVGLADSTPYFKQQLPNGRLTTEWKPLGGATEQIAVISNNDSHGPYLVSIAEHSSSVYFWYSSINNNGSYGIPLGGLSSSVYGTTGKDEEPLIFSIAKDSGSVFQYKIGDQPAIDNNEFGIETYFYGNLSSPDTITTSMAFLDRDSIILLQKNDGKVQLISNRTLLEQPILDLNVNGLGERGLLGVAVKNITSEEMRLRIDQDSKKFVFLYVTEAETDGSSPLGNRLYRYEFNGTHLVNPALLLDLPATYMNHNAGKIKVAPDGSIFVVIGDQNRTGIFQNLNQADRSPTGVIFHIDSTGKPIPQNPFYDFSSNPLIQSIYAYGLRNSFGLAIDPVAGLLWDTENGDIEYDEINLVFAGFNSGWKIISGPSSPGDKHNLTLLPQSRYMDPILSYKDSIGITDIEFLNSHLYGPELFGSLFVADINNGNLYFFELNSTRTGFILDDQSLSNSVIDNPAEQKKVLIGSGFGSGITDIESGPDGRLYILTLGGKIFVLTDQKN